MGIHDQIQYLMLALLFAATIYWIGDSGRYLGSLTERFAVLKWRVEQVENKHRPSQPTEDTASE